MRKQQKKEILEVISSLKEAHKEICKELEQKRYEAGMSLLCDCQDCALELGNIIEVLEGEEAITISYIEKYCEILFNGYEKLNKKVEELDNNKKILKKIIEPLNKQLSNIENSINNDIKEKKEIVFFPYKASMWDSLESIYLEMKKDESCDVYCVPIPYYDKNPNGSLGIMHYEGREYPKNIEVMDWRTYDYKERMPDAIYIHNPYDDLNIVTSVHEDYFARNLKAYTEKLVYIPYFVHQNDCVSEHYCKLPGVVFADEVILQSEKVKEEYIKYYSEFMNSFGKVVIKKEIERKFLASGSPKLNINQEVQYEIPDEWKEFIDKDKKIIFFNTHIRGIMRGSEEAFLKKLKWVFDFFKNDKSTVLLWRPHPLMIQTAKAMNPEAIKPYIDLVNYYRNEKIGIYDESSNLQRAIALSDAYYGDKSSVVELFKAAKKPVMIMDHQIL